MAHTSPGPWELSYPYVLDSTGAVVCRVSPIEEETPRDVANGRLIASVKELLAACEKALDNLDEIPGKHRQWACEILEAAIARAKG